jgi:superfamily II DNA or RNA helicase/HKD family nuclease
VTSEPVPASGLYEQLVTSQLQDVLDADTGLRAEVAKVDPADQPHVLARHIYELTRAALENRSDQDARADLIDKLAVLLAAPAARVHRPARQLQRLAAPSGPGVADIESVRPKTPLSDAALLTNSTGEPNLAAELRAEIDTSDEVDLLCAFVKWHGLRLLEDELGRLRRRRAPLRVITTTYMGATERAALDRLVRELGAEVKIQYDAARTRLHAKAWMFRRQTRYDTAYVGSSNLSRAALLDGVEWNVRLSRVATPSLLDKFRGTFDTYWNDASFELYDPDRDRDRLDDALAEASGRQHHDRVTISLSGLEVRPYPYQQHMLDELAVERDVHDRHRNLVVAATGTGKTVVAALDYRRLCGPTSNHRPRLLFVAHRKEILEQSLRTYREALADPTFGELYVAGTRPERWDHVFASVQSLQSYGVANIPAATYDIVVIDEFHHAQAPTYRRLLDHLTPRELLGLTATPERADGIDVRAEFFDGRTATELRLWDALGQDLLCPFHYFAVADGTDLRRISWARGRYDEGELSHVYTGNQARAAIVLQQLREKVIAPGAMRALGFCVSVAHARFMAEAFNAAGIPALAVSGDTPAVERQRALEDLKSRRVNVLFAADLFNEGLDLPDVDTVLFLRPTESATVFLQQLGRGLRRTPDKAVLTVLDFVGHQRQEFRFDKKLRALTGETRRGLEREIERGFPFLPSGCQIVMDRHAQSLILENLRTQVANSWKSMTAELRSYGDLDLPTFVHESGVELPDILRRGQRSWTQLRRDAGLPTAPGTAREGELLKRIRAFAHVDDGLRATGYRRFLGTPAPYDELTQLEQRLARMLFFSTFPSGGGFTSYDDGLTAIRTDQAVTTELSAVIDLVFDETRHDALSLSEYLPDVPLRVHASYQREEILAALDYANLQRKPTSMMQGVAYSDLLNVDALFVTLKKSEADYSPTTMYRDYPISPTLFHWESQNATSIASPTGQRYLNGTSTVLLFCRVQSKGEYDTAPYVLLGPASYVSHVGERPIAITWELRHAMPSALFAAASLASS